MVRLECTSLDALVHPTGIENDFSLLSGILSVKALAAFAVWIDWTQICRQIYFQHSLQAYLGYTGLHCSQERRSLRDSEMEQIMNYDVDQTAKRVRLRAQRWGLCLEHPFRCR